MQPPTWQGRWIIDLWHNMEAQGVSVSLTEISSGLLSNRILTEVSTLKAVTCPLWHPSGYLMLSWIWSWIFSARFSPLRRSWEREGSTGCSFSTDLKRCHMLWNVTPKCRNHSDKLGSFTNCAVKKKCIWICLSFAHWGELIVLLISSYFGSGRTRVSFDFIRFHRLWLLRSPSSRRGHAGHDLCFLFKQCIWVIILLYVTVLNSAIIIWRSIKNTVMTNACVCVCLCVLLLVFQSSRPHFRNQRSCRIRWWKKSEKGRKINQRKKLRDMFDPPWVRYVRQTFMARFHSLVPSLCCFEWSLDWECSA